MLPGERTNIGYLNFAPLITMAGDQMGAEASVILNYLKPFKWLSYADEAPVNGVQRGSIHIGIEGEQ